MTPFLLNLKQLAISIAYCKKCWLIGFWMYCAVLTVKFYYIKVSPSVFSDKNNI